MAKIKTAISDYKPDFRLMDERGLTPERIARAEFRLERGDTGTIRMRDTPIEKALQKRVINDGQYQAAQKFYNHWFRGGMAGSLQSMDMDRVFGGEFGFSGAPRSEIEQFHRERYRRAVELTGGRGSQILQKVVCEEKDFAIVGMELGWDNRPQAYAVAVQLCREALSILADEWGIS